MTEHFSRFARVAAILAIGFSLAMSGAGASSALAETDDPFASSDEFSPAAPDMEDEWRLIEKVRLDRRAGTTALGYVLDRPALISLARLLGPAGAEYYLATGRFETDLARAAGPTAWLDREVRRFLASSAKRAPAPSEGRATR